MHLHDEFQRLLPKALNETDVHSVLYAIVVPKLM